MKLSESIPGAKRSTLEDVNTWGICHIKNLVAVMGEILERSGPVGAVEKRRLSWIFYSMEDKIEEIETCLYDWVKYVYDLEQKVKTLSSKVERMGG